METIFADTLRLDLEHAAGACVMSVFECDLDSVRAAVAACNASRLLDLVHDAASFWCPHCSAAYCTDHWSLTTEWDTTDPDRIWGRCPREHARLLFDY